MYNIQLNTEPYTSKVHLNINDTPIQMNIMNVYGDIKRRIFRRINSGQ